MHGWGTGGYGLFGWPGMAINLIITLGVIIGIVLLIVWLVRNVSSNQKGGNSGSTNVDKPLSAREILQIRYVRGEIDREKYHEMLEDISNRPEN